MLQISHSIISESCLRKIIEEYYAFSDSVECKYLFQGLNDSYLILFGEKKYIFRIYRNGRRTLDSINAEIEYISHLDNKSKLVAVPIADKNGDILKEFNY